MKNLITIIICLALCIISQAQRKKAITGEALYEFVHSLDSLHSYVDSSNNITEGKLLFSQTKSRFVSGLKSARNGSSLTETNEGYNVRLSNTDTTGEVQFINQLTDSIYSREIYINKELITGDKIPKITWLIQNNYKTIKGIKCQEAIGSFRGRNYTAWYTESIPVSAGPWKLCGLPGLILEAYDSTKQVQFILKELIYPSDKIDSKLIPGMDISKSLSRQDAEKQRKKIQSNYRALAEGLLPEGASVNMTFTEKNLIERAY